MALRIVACLAGCLALMGLLGSCAGERPTLGAGDPGTSSTGATNTSAPSSVATPSTAPAAPDAVGPDGLGPDDLLGYIATPGGVPAVYETAAEDAPTIDISATTEFGAPTTFAVVGDPTADGSPWVQVLLPTRPNGATAYVARSSVAVTKTPMRIFIDLGSRSLRVERDGIEVLATTTAIGTEQNPTPAGASYVTELIDNEEPGGAYGPYAFGLALHSETLSEFGGGDGQVGIHGTNQPDKIGQAVSHGCVRLTNDDVEKLVGLQLPLGVPVFIT